MWPRSTPSLGTISFKKLNVGPILMINGGDWGGKSKV
jgi:hypothetical protein